MPFVPLSNSNTAPSSGFTPLASSTPAPQEKEGIASKVLDTAKEFGKATLETPTGVAEGVTYTYGQVGVFANQIIGDVVGLGGAVMGENSYEDAHKVGDQMAAGAEAFLQPETPIGKTTKKAVDLLFGVVPKIAKWTGEETALASNSPVLGAVTEASINVLAPVGAFKGFKVLESGAKAAIKSYRPSVEESLKTVGADSKPEETVPSKDTKTPSDISPRKEPLFYGEEESFSRMRDSTNAEQQVLANHRIDAETRDLLNERQNLLHISTPLSEVEKSRHPMDKSPQREVRPRTEEENLRIKEIEDQVHKISIKYDPRGSLKTAQEETKDEIKQLEEDPKTSYSQKRLPIAKKFLADLNEFERRASEKASPTVPDEKDSTEQDEPWWVENQRTLLQEHVLEHEKAHIDNPQEEGESTLAYEQRINEIAKQKVAENKVNRDADKADEEATTIPDVGVPDTPMNEKDASDFLIKLRTSDQIDQVAIENLLRASKARGITPEMNERILHWMDAKAAGLPEPYSLTEQEQHHYDTVNKPLDDAYKAMIDYRRKNRKPAFAQGEDEVVPRIMKSSKDPVGDKWWDTSKSVPENLLNIKNKVAEALVKFGEGNQGGLDQNITKTPEGAHQRGLYVLETGEVKGASPKEEGEEFTSSHINAAYEAGLISEWQFKRLTKVYYGKKVNIERQNKILSNKKSTKEEKAEAIRKIALSKYAKDHKFMGRKQTKTTSHTSKRTS